MMKQSNLFFQLIILRETISMPKKIEEDEIIIVI